MTTKFWAAFSKSEHLSGGSVIAKNLWSKSPSTPLVMVLSSKGPHFNAYVTIWDANWILKFVSMWGPQPMRFWWFRSRYEKQGRKEEKYKKNRWRQTLRILHISVCEFWLLLKLISERLVLVCSLFSSPPLWLSMIQSSLWEASKLWGQAFYPKADYPQGNFKR